MRTAFFFPLEGKLTRVRTRNQTRNEKTTKVAEKIVGHHHHSWPWSSPISVFFFVVGSLADQWIEPTKITEDAQCWPPPSQTDMAAPNLGVGKVNS